MTEPTAPGVSEQDGAGIPDGFARLWMPHRMAYIKGENKPPAPGRVTAARSAGFPRSATRTA